jgi:hypothetical protein
MHQSLCNVVETSRVLIRYKMVWVVAWVVGHELCLSCTEPILEAGLAECMPAIRQSNRCASMTRRERSIQLNVHVWGPHSRRAYLALQLIA